MPERLFFANAGRVVDHIAAVAGNQQPPPRVVLVDLGAVNDLEITAGAADGSCRELHRQGSALWAAAPNERPLQMLRRVAELLGRTDLQADIGRLGVRLFPNLDDAIAAYQEQTLPDHPPS